MEQPQGDETLIILTRTPRRKTMNIDDYRAMVKEEQAQKDSSEGEQPDAQAQQGTTEPVLEGDQQAKPPEPEATETGEQATPPEEPSTPPKAEEPTSFTIEGIGKVSLEELQNGYLRQSDYTRKSQEVARHRKEADQALQVYTQLQQDPEKAKQLSEEYSLPQLDPSQSRMLDMETKYHDLLLERDIEKLSTKYTDFNETEVIQMALDKKLNLEDAYQLVKQGKPVIPTETPQVDIASIKEQIRQELMQELQLNKDTQSIIQRSGDTPPSSAKEVSLTASEKKVAGMMKMTSDEYAKWRDKK